MADFLGRSYRKERVSVAIKKHTLTAISKPLCAFANLSFVRSSSKCAASNGDSRGVAALVEFEVAGGGAGGGDSFVPKSQLKS